MKSRIILISFIALFLASCEKNDIICPDPGQLVLFQVEYVNHAWSYSHSGIVIDSAGKVGYFRLPENWHSPDSLGYISESDMNDNYKQLNDVAITVTKDALHKFYGMLPDASQGKLSEPYNRMFDAGVTIYSGFLFFPSLRKYKQVMIKQWGDWQIDNYSPEAEEIFNWLKIVYTGTLESLQNRQ